MNIFREMKENVLGNPIVIFHEFHKPPYGGGNQFLLALKKELERCGYHIGVNKVGIKTKVCLFNSFNFDFEELRRINSKYKLRMIHRVDGPVGVYRGTEGDIDRRIWELNHELASATVFQSQYSFNKHLELGLKFLNPVVINNAVDSGIFNPHNRINPPSEGRKIKLIATSWSDNPRKGGPVYKWLEQNLDWDRFEFTFVGRTKETFTKISHISACSSEILAEILRQHDIYITASQDDPCSNALLEALACGLPTVFLRSGGHPELVGEGGIGFIDYEETLSAIDKILRDYLNYQSKIKVASISEIVQKYLEVLLNHD